MPAAEIPDKDFRRKWPAARTDDSRERSGECGSEQMRVHIFARPRRRLRGGARPARRRGANSDPAPSNSGLWFAVPVFAPPCRWRFSNSSTPRANSNNTRSIRVRYNAMLARTALDGACAASHGGGRRASSNAGHVFVPRQPRQIRARLRRHAFYRVLAESDEHPFVTAPDGLNWRGSIIDPNNR